MKPIFIVGPHGSGKTTLISKLIVKSDRFIKDDYMRWVPWCIKVDIE